MRHCGLGFATSGRLLGMAATTVRGVFYRLQKAQWVPEQRRSLAQKAQEARQSATPVPQRELPEVSETDAEIARMQRLVRAAMASASEGDSGLRFERDIERLRVHGRAIAFAVFWGHACLHRCPNFARTFHCELLERVCEALRCLVYLSLASTRT